MGISYTVVRLADLANPVGALANGHMSTSAFRVWLAAVEAKAIREAASRRKQSQVRLRRPTVPRFSVGELGRIAGLSRRTAGRALRELIGAGILAFSPDCIDTDVRPLERFEDWVTTLSCGRSEKRLLPLPRPFLRHLARCPRAGVLLTAVGYLVRGLSLAPRTGEIRNRGTLKASWVAETFGLSLRTARYAQGELRRIGWLSKDTGSTQRKLNRDGAYFVIDPVWRPSTSPLAKRPTGTPPESQPELVSRDLPAPGLAPLQAGIGARFAPPGEDGETPSDRKHQRPRSTEPAGGCSSVGGRGRTDRPPDIRNIRTEDLGRLDRVAALYRQAVRVGWLAESEANALNFTAAAVRAREIDGEPPRVFVSLVRCGLWHHITQAQEERARRALSRFREVDPDLFRTGVLS